MKRALLFAACLTLLASATAFAQRTPMRTPPASVVNVSGAVKGRPSNRTFVLASGRGTYNVDASHATVRFKGKFFSISNLTPGSFVVAHGTVRGTTLVATAVEVTRLAGLKLPVRGAPTTTPPKRGGTKGGAKKGTTGGTTGKGG